MVAMMIYWISKMMVAMLHLNLETSVMLYCIMDGGDGTDDDDLSSHKSKSRCTMMSPL